MSIHIERSAVERPEPSSAGPDASVARVRAAALVLALGPAIWAAGIVAQSEPGAEKIGFVENLTSIAFLFGAAGMALILLITRATGPRKGRAFPIGLLALLSGALVFSLGAIKYETYASQPLWVNIADFCWPLSMVMTLATGIAVAKVGRYRGFLRWQVLLCGLWLPVAMLSEAAGDLGVYAAALWLLASYSFLGVRLAMRPADATGTHPLR